MFVVSSEPTICLAISHWCFATGSRYYRMQGILWSVLMMAMMIMMKIHMVMAMMEMLKLVMVTMKMEMPGNNDDHEDGKGEEDQKSDDQSGQRHKIAQNEDQTQRIQCPMVPKS